MIKVSADYAPPLNFNLVHPNYRAASALTLSCEVMNADNTAEFRYVWTTTCTRGCFVLGEISVNVSTTSLHSYDSGVHTCTVCDNLVCVGSANITINVVGKDMAGMVSCHKIS